MMDKLTWKTDRKDLVEAVRTLSPAKARALYLKCEGKTPRGLSAQDVYNAVMVAVLDGRIPQEKIIDGKPQT